MFFFVLFSTIFHTSARNIRKWILNYQSLRLCYYFCFFNFPSVNHDGHVSGCGNTRAGKSCWIERKVTVKFSLLGLNGFEWNFGNGSSSTCRLDYRSRDSYHERARCCSFSTLDEDETRAELARTIDRWLRINDRRVIRDSGYRSSDEYKLIGDMLHAENRSLTLCVRSTEELIDTSATESFRYNDAVPDSVDRQMPSWR